MKTDFNGLASFTHYFNQAISKGNFKWTVFDIEGVKKGTSLHILHILHILYVMLIESTVGGGSVSVPFLPQSFVIYGIKYLNILSERAFEF